MQEQSPVIEALLLSLHAQNQKDIDSATYILT
jgi:hypothetical protein